MACPPPSPLKSLDGGVPLRTFLESYGGKGFEGLSRVVRMPLDLYALLHPAEDAPRHFLPFRMGRVHMCCQLFDEEAIEFDFVPDAPTRRSRIILNGSTPRLRITRSSYSWTARGTVASPALRPHASLSAAKRRDLGGVGRAQAATPPSTDEGGHPSQLQILALDPVGSINSLLVGPEAILERS